MTMNTGGRMASKRPPRRQAANIPIRVPRTNAITVAVPTSPTLHGSASITTLPTDEGKKLSDVPKSPCSVLPR